MCPSNNSSSIGYDHSSRVEGKSASASEPAMLINRQRSVRADWAAVRKFLDELRSRVAKRPFTICLVSDRSIRRYNKQYRQKDQPTDVLSFPAGNGAEPPGYLGDILISVETARRSAARFRLALQEEIKILSLHGVLHLMGYDHETDRGRMARAERLWSDRLRLGANLSARSAARTARPRGRESQ
jgi:probable rRNA maturation factor